MLKSILVNVTIFACATFTYSQLILSDFPKKYQLYPRDAHDSAVISVAGMVTAVGRDSVSLETYKNGVIINREACKLSYVGANAEFSFSPKIHAELSEYSVKLYIDNQLAAQGDSLVCGDVFLLDGQSNMNPNGPLMYQKSQWFRGFGKRLWTVIADPPLYCCPSDTFWYVAISKDVPTVGQVVAFSIIDSFKVPVCMLSAALSGTTIKPHLKNWADPMNLSTIYGSLLFRMTKAKLLNKAKAMFWYQGEYNTSNPENDWTYKGYKSLFDSLRSDWKADFGIDKVYLFQIRFDIDFREAQRQITLSYPDVEMMPTVGTSGYGGVHFYTNGTDTNAYFEQGQRLFLQVKKDYYGSLDTQFVRPPKIVDAYFSSPYRNEIIFQFDQPVLWPMDTLITIDGGFDTIRMKDYFPLNYNHKVVPYLSVDSGKSFTDERKVVLYLNEPIAHGSKVSYLDNSEEYRTNTEKYQAPWLKNPRGVPVPAFSVIINDAPATGIDESSVSIPKSNTSLLVSPNPFYSSVNISVSGFRKGDKLGIYDINGRAVANLESEFISNAYSVAEVHRVSWNASRLASGVYLVVFNRSGVELRNKILLIR
jgi:hypothetical protein